MNRSKKLVAVLAVMSCVLGLACILYPYASDYLNAVERAKVVDNQQQAIEKASEDDLQSWLDEALLYNERLVNSKTVVTDPFDPAFKPVTDDDYTRALNVSGDGMMGTLSIPSIETTLPIYHGTDEEQLRHGVGHLQNTSLPVGGESAHCVLAGHTGLPATRIFDDLDQVKEGDYVFFSILNREFAYKVYKIEVVLPEDTSSLAIIPGEDTITLVTCTPYGVNSHRLLVHAERTDVPEWWINRNVDNSAPAVIAVPKKVALPFLTSLGVVIGLLVVGGVLVRRRIEENLGGKDAGSSRPRHFAE